MSEQVAPNGERDLTSAVGNNVADTTLPNDEHFPQVDGQQDEKLPRPNDEPPQSEWHALYARIPESFQDGDFWRRLVELAENSGNLDRIKTTYEALLETYPNTASIQIAYLDNFLIPGSFSYAQELFKRFLKNSPSVDLWKFYLTYVRRVNTDPATRDDVRMAYEFALSRVGHDKDSGEIWSDFIQFIKAGEATTTWEEQQKMDALRKVYHRAVQIPLENVEKLWSDLEAFETGLNKITAKKFMADLSPSYMQARTVLRQLQKHVGPLFPPIHSTPSSTSSIRPPLFIPSPPTFNPQERALVGAWKNYLKWEESNPLEIEEKDKAMFITRVQSVYRKALVRMRYYAEIWYMAYVWTSSVGKAEEALAILKAGLVAHPTGFLLNFALAELLESRKEFAEVHEMYTGFLEKLKIDLDNLETKLGVNGTVGQPSGSVAGQTVNSPITSDAHPSTQPLTQPHDQTKDQSFDSTSSSNGLPRELSVQRTEYGLAWIMYMRFARRAEGIKSFRTAFRKARKERWTPWEVYEASALMEYHCSKSVTVASRIFELGLETFRDEIEFVLRYLGFLISVNDEANARALFEKVIPTFPPENARHLWERWARYEYQYGDLDAALKLEKRISEVYPSDPPIKRFAQRHIYLGTDAIATRALGFAMARQSPSANSSQAKNNVSGSTAGSLGRTETHQNLLTGLNQPQGQAHSYSQPQSQSQPPPHGHGAHSGSNKRPPSPIRRERDDLRHRGGMNGQNSRSDYGPAHKRARPMSPQRDRDWERDRDRDHMRDSRDRGRRLSPPPPPSIRDRDGKRPERERDDERPLGALPPVVSWFVGQLPPPAAFDGPVFRTDDLLSLFRNAVIPSTSSIQRGRSPPPVPPPRSGGRPPPDYGPYQGPGGGRPGRRY